MSRSYFRIVIDKNIPLLGQALAAYGDVTELDGRSMRAADLNACDALFVRSVTRVDKSLLHASPVRFIATATSGADHVDIDYLNTRDIVFASARGCNSLAVAEYALFAMLHWARIRATTLAGKCIGIVGFGAIGKRVAAIAAQLSMRTLVNDPPLRDRHYTFPDYCDYAELPELLSNADIATVHTPLISHGAYPTRHLIGCNEIRTLKKGALLIQAARGGIVDEQAVIERLRDDSLAAVFDVWENEPHIDTDLAQLALIATPHIAGHTVEGKLNGAAITAEAFARFAGFAFDPAPFALAERTLTEACAPRQTLYEVLHRERALIDDSRNLQRALADPDIAAVFDSLRKRYPARRESLRHS